MLPIKHFDRTDLLVNNAGIYIQKPFTDYTQADFELMIHANIAGYFFITQRVVAQMRKQKSGHIVGISTVLVDQPWPARRCRSLCSPSPPCPAFNRALAMEFLADGIRANTISPGIVDSPMNANYDHELLKKSTHSAVGSNLGNRGCIALFAIGTHGKRRKHPH